MKVHFPLELRGDLLFHLAVSATGTLSFFDNRTNVRVFVGNPRTKITENQLVARFFRDVTVHM